MWRVVAIGASYWFGRLSFCYCVGSLLDGRGGEAVVLVPVAGVVPWWCYADFYWSVAGDWSSE